MTNTIYGKDLDKIEVGMMFEHHVAKFNFIVTNEYECDEMHDVLHLNDGMCDEMFSSDINQCKYLGRAVLSKDLPAGTPFDEVMKSFKGEM